MHSRTSGVTDHIAEDDSHALAIARNIVANLGEPPRLRWTVEEIEPPCHATEEIHGIVSANRRIPTDNREILARLIDGSRFQEFKHLHGETMLCGFARIHGFEIGILANNGVLFSESALKGAHFIELCCKRDIPLLFLVDVSGFMVGSAVERQGIAKHGAKFMTAMACADVPKYTVITGGSYAAAYFAMLGRAFRPNATLMWPSAHAALMGPEQAATTLAMVRDNIHAREGTSWTDEERENYKQPILRDFEAFANPYNFARNLWCDMVIEPAETREVMAMLLDLAGRTPVNRPDSACFGCSGFAFRLCPPKARQRHILADCFADQHDVHVERDLFGLAAGIGADHPRAFFQVNQQDSVGEIGLECGTRCAVYHAEGMDLAAPACRTMAEIFAAALPAHRLLVVLHVAAIGAVLQQQHAVAQAAPEHGGIRVGCRQRLLHGVFGRDHSVFSVPRMVVALVAKPAPRLCTSPSSAPGTWRSPHRPRNCAMTS